MDWEKKTAARPPLKEAAADVFNDTRTPGQALLSALQSAETVGRPMLHCYQSRECFCILTPTTGSPICP